MSKFFKYILGIILLIIAFAYALDWMYTSAFQTGFSRNKVQYVVQLENTHIDYIFLGSSRVENHIDCEVITALTGKSCINFGLQGSKTNDSAALLQILKDNKVTYEKVLFQLDYAVNYDSYVPAFLASIAPFENTDQLSPALQNKLNAPSGNKLPFVRFAANEKMIGIREVMLQYIQKPSSVDLDNGFLKIDRVGTKIKGKLPDTIVKENYGVQWMKDIEPQNLILYTAPYCENAANRSKFKQELSKVYPEVVSYLELFDHRKEYFADCGHLNTVGAREFSALLASELLMN